MTRKLMASTRPFAFLGGLLGEAVERRHDDFERAPDDTGDGVDSEDAQTDVQTRGNRFGQKGQLESAWNFANG